MPEIYDFEEMIPFLSSKEVEDGDKVTFINEGRMTCDKWGTDRLQIDIVLLNQERRRMTVNKISRRNLARAFGYNSQDWIDKTAVVRKELITIAGKQVEALVLYP